MARVPVLTCCSVCYKLSTEGLAWSSRQARLWAMEQASNAAEDHMAALEASAAAQGASISVGPIVPVGQASFGHVSLRFGRHGLDEASVDAFMDIWTYVYTSTWRRAYKHAFDHYYSQATRQFMIAHAHAGPVCVHHVLRE
jgi:hypothetical protein